LENDLEFFSRESCGGLENKAGQIKKEEWKLKGMIKTEGSGPRRKLISKNREGNII